MDESISDQLTDFVNEPEYKRRLIQLIRYYSFNLQIIE